MSKKLNEIASLSSNSQEIIERFKEYYQHGSMRTYAPTINNIIRLTQKRDLAELTFEDYNFCQEKLMRASGPNPAVISFFQFLFGYEYLKNPYGFTENLRWFEDKIVDEFERKKAPQSQSKNNRNSNNFPVLRFADIEKLIVYEETVDTYDFDSAQLAFCFFMIFYEGIDVNLFKTSIDTKEISSCEFMIEEQAFHISEKYLHFIQNKKLNQRTKFSNLSDYIHQLGDKVGISDLQPKHIQKARADRLIMCSECEEKYLNFSCNWKDVNGKIVCSKCADKLCNDDLKKNILTEILSIECNVLSDNEKQSIIFAGNSYKNSLSNLKLPTDFVSLNKFLQDIGRLGEKYVLEHEKVRLISQNRPDLAELVSLSPSIDNTNGYDILSYTSNGEEIYIEVKTSIGDEDSSFYISQRELDTARYRWTNGKKYQIYRVFNINDERLISHKIYDFLDETEWEFKSIEYKVQKKKRSSTPIP